MLITSKFNHEIFKVICILGELNKILKIYKVYKNEYEGD